MQGLTQSIIRGLHPISTKNTLFSKKGHLKFHHLPTHISLKNISKKKNKCLEIFQERGQSPKVGLIFCQDQGLVYFLIFRLLACRDLSKHFYVRYTAQKTQCSEFSISIFINLKHFGVEILFKAHWLTTFLLFSVFYLSFRCKKAKIIQELYPVNPHQGSAMNPLRSLRPSPAFYNI